ncbi:MAG: glycosyltransferase family 4 protein [Fibrobacteria bacterium]
MKVMMFTGAVPELRSGVGDYVHEVYKALRGKLDLVLVTSDAVEVKPELFPEARVYKVARTWGAADLPAIAEIIVKEKPDIFHQQYPSLMGGPTNRALLSNMLPAWLKWKHRGTPLITTLHEFGERRIRWRARACFNALLSDGIITITSKDAGILKRWKSNVRRVPLVSNIPRVARPVRAAQERYQVAFFGLLDPMKGLERFIEIAGILGAERYRFTILGGFDADSNPYHAGLLDLLRRADLEGAFMFAGHAPRAEVARVLAESDCCLLPFEEGVSERRTSLLAALMQGTPVVSTDGPYTPEDYRGIAGLALLPPRDAHGMAAKVAELCARGVRPNEFDTLVRGISHDALGQGHLDAYREALARKGMGA